MSVERNKDVNSEDLDLLLKKLDALVQKLINESKLFLTAGGEDGSGSVYTMDLFISGIVNRAISLIYGFKLLSLDNNYISAVPLIRMQLDNCLRFYAATLVTDYDDFFMKYLKGEHVRNLKDADGNKMTDNYLVKLLDKKIMPGVKNLYKNTSGHIHLSNEHSFLQTEVLDGDKKEMVLRTHIGKVDFFKIDQKVDFVYNMYVVSKLLLRLVSSWKYQKLRVETLMKNRNEES